MITDWPGLRLNATNEKVPSQIAYGSQFEGGFEWGNKIKPRTKRETWTKLLLDEREKSNELKMTLQLLTGNRDPVDIIDGQDDDTRPPPYPGKTPVEIIGDFLSGVKKHLESNLKTRYGKTILSLFEMEVVITVPAMWSDKAKDLTCQAIFKAGFDSEDIKVSMIAEPEAAAIYILRELRDGPFSNIVVGPTILAKVRSQIFTLLKGRGQLRSLRRRRRNSCRSARYISARASAKESHVGRISSRIVSTPSTQRSKSQKLLLALES